MRDRVFYHRDGCYESADDEMRIYGLANAIKKLRKMTFALRVLCAREIFTRFFCIAKLLKLLVARDGIEPPTPAFSGPRSTN